MQNKHLEHPEDCVISGDLNVLNWFTAKGNISAKIDGSPAIVWGTNPATNLFFVGTKSVFNKKLIKINHNHGDIDRNHQGQVADICISVLTIFLLQVISTKVILSVLVAAIITILTPSDISSKIKLPKKS